MFGFERIAIWMWNDGCPWRRRNAVVAAVDEQRLLIWCESLSRTWKLKIKNVLLVSAFRADSVR